MDGISPLDEVSLQTGTTTAIHAGFPNPAAERTRKPLSLDALLIRSPSSTYFFRVRGHAWHRIGVYDGDIAIVDRSLTPHAGATVIWWTEAGELRLAKWDPTLTTNTWGVITSIIHSFELRG